MIATVLQKVCQKAAENVKEWALPPVKMADQLKDFQGQLHIAIMRQSLTSI